MPLALDDAVELACRIRKAARHRENAAGFVPEYKRRSLHGRSNAQIGTRRLLALGFAHLNIDHVVRLETAPDRGAPGVQRQDASVGQTDVDRIAALATRILQDDRRFPVNVIER